MVYVVYKQRSYDNNIISLCMIFIKMGCNFGETDYRKFEHLSSNNIKTKPYQTSQNHNIL